MAAMPMMTGLKCIICVPAALSAIYFIAQDALLILPRSLTGLDLNGRNELTVTDRRGIQTAVTVMPSTFVAAYLTVLNVRLEDSRFWQRNLILTPDRVDQDAFRQLRVWLRWHNDGPGFGKRSRGNSGKNQNKTSAVSEASDF
jgi:toxin CptA